LETQYFETPVLRARLERRAHEMVLVMQLRAQVAPVLSTGADPSGFTFTYIDFAPGHYLPATPPPPPVAATLTPRREDEAASARVRPASPSSRAAYPVEEDERPPPVDTSDDSF